MIDDIPSSYDFKNAGKAQFNFACDIIVSFLKLFDEVADYNIIIDEESTDNFWEAASSRFFQYKPLHNRVLSLF